MLRLSDLAVVGREVRQDDAHDLGRPTQELICEAVDQGRPEEAKQLARYMVPEGKGLHDLRATHHPNRVRMATGAVITRLEPVGQILRNGVERGMERVVLVALHGECDRLAVRLTKMHHAAQHIV